MSSPLNKLAFLIVDDNANMVMIVRTILKNFGIIHIYEAKTSGRLSPSSGSTPSTSSSSITTSASWTGSSS